MRIQKRSTPSKFDRLRGLLERFGSVWVCGLSRKTVHEIGGALGAKTREITFSLRWTSLPAPVREPDGSWTSQILWHRGFCRTRNGGRRQHALRII